MLSLVVPVYRNEESIPSLIEALGDIDRRVGGELEAVLVVDGSPDRSFEKLAEALVNAPFRSQLLALSRNFGSLPAILAGLTHGQGPRYAVMAADLQEPSTLLVQFDELLRAGEHDVVVGARVSRSDPFLYKLGGDLFWRLYSWLVQPEMPYRGVDVFACNRRVRDELIRLRELNTSLVGLLYWLGFRRAEVPYGRHPRRHGRSAWTLTRRVRYLIDSTVAFSRLPLTLLTLAGCASLLLAGALGTGWWGGWRPAGVALGQVAVVLTVMVFGGLNLVALGVLGEYLWRAYENTKNRPPYVVAAQHHFPAQSSDE